MFPENVIEINDNKIKTNEQILENDFTLTIFLGVFRNKYFNESNEFFHKLIKS